GPFGPQPYLERAPAQTFRDLVTWQLAHRFVVCVYQMTASFPKSETFGLSSQLRRAAVSVAANIAEGFKRRGKGDKARFLNMAQASLEECRYYLILTQDLQYGETDAPMALLEEASKCLEGYIQRILNSDYL
ncbi:MAG TPA: four helix bundle protein, partial [Bryobacteraceae bacterium]|nr:four helix bundle protein [Bryobacteraceae bacterium]